MNKRNNIIILLVIALFVIGLWALNWFLIIHNINSWPDRGTFGDMFGVVNSLFSGLAFIGITYSIYLQINSLQKDHERRRKQSTIEHVRLIRPFYKEQQIKLELELGTDPLGTDKVNKIFNEPDLRHKTKEFLSALEHLSVGVNSNIFDLHIIYRLMGTFLIRTYHQFRPYIMKVKSDHNSAAYIELEKLKNDLQKIKDGGPPQFGDIANI